MMWIFLLATKNQKPLRKGNHIPQLSKAQADQRQRDPWERVRIFFQLEWHPGYRVLTVPAPWHAWLLLLSQNRCHLEHCLLGNGTGRPCWSTGDSWHLFSKHCGDSKQWSLTASCFVCAARRVVTRTELPYLFLLINVTFSGFSS